MKKKILVVDIGGSNVKLMISAEGKAAKISVRPEAHTGGRGQADQECAEDWEFDAISIGFPPAVQGGKI